MNGQIAHHHHKTLKEEFLAFLKRNKIEHDPRHIWGDMRILPSLRDLIWARGDPRVETRGYYLSSLRDVICARCESAFFPPCGNQSVRDANPLFFRP